MFSKICSTISVQSSSKLVDSKTIAVLDWKFRISTIELPSVGESFSILAFRTSLTFVWLWKFSKAFCLTASKNVLGSKVRFVALIVCSSTNPFKADLLLSSNFRKQAHNFFLEIVESVIDWSFHRLWNKPCQPIKPSSHLSCYPFFFWWGNILCWFKWLLTHFWNVIVKQTSCGSTSHDFFINHLWKTISQKCLQIFFSKF